MSHDYNATFPPGFHRPLGVVPPSPPGYPYTPSPLYYSTPYYSPSHFYPDKLYQQCWPPPYYSESYALPLFQQGNLLLHSKQPNILFSTH